MYSGFEKKNIFLYFYSPFYSVWYIFNTFTAKFSSR